MAFLLRKFSLNFKIIKSPPGKLREGVNEGGIFTAKKKKETYPHFRLLKYKEGPKKNKHRHPKIILEKENDTYHYMGMTESSKRGRHKNIPLSQNPKRGDSRQAYVRKEYLVRPTDDFLDILYDYKLSDADKASVLAHAAKLKQKKKK